MIVKFFLTASPCSVEKNFLMISLIRNVEEVQVLS